MDGYTLFTIILTVAAVLIIQRFYQDRKSHSTSGQKGITKSSYREEAFAEIIKINEDSIKQGMVDPLTGLPGRQIYDERLSMILKHSREYNQIFSVMILNIDEFNNINRIYGGVFGNKLLAEAANRLRMVLRQVDTVSRYAGDSFFFILPELSNPEVAVLVAQRIQDSIIKPFVIDNHKIFVTASIGIAIYSRDNDKTETIIKDAEDALTKAKLAGRNTYRIHNQPEAGLDQHDSLLHQHFKSHDFLKKLVMYYQPYIDVTTGKTHTIQAIPFYNDPETGLVPIEEINLALENSGKNVEFCKWQLEQAITQFKHWETNGYQPPNMMLTITISQLEDTQFIHKVSEILQQTGFDSGQIIFDISESSFNANNASFKAALDTAEIMGIQLSIGIMALGRLALHNISEFPINYLKIDDNLVKDLMADMNNESIITSLIGLAYHSRIEVMASGVDHDNQKVCIQALGCTVMKGKLFLMPVTANEMFDAEVSKLHETAIAD